MKKVIKILQNYSLSVGIDMQSAFVGMLNFFIDTFSIEKFLSSRGDMVSILESRREGNPEMFDVLSYWLKAIEEHSIKGEAYDFFGELYETMFLSKSKASALGQFFTPMPLSQIMVSLTQDKSATIVGEPSCGSGRNVLAHWQAADKSKLIEYRCEDLDPTSAKMCALNMMANGMYGSVICHDSLDPASFHFGYAINEIRYPFPSPYFSIRAITSQEYLCKNIHQ